MLSVGEANMGLGRGGGFRSDFGFGMDAGGGSSNVVLQQQLNDLIHNSYLLHQHHDPTQCSEPSQLLVPPGGSFASQHGLAALGLDTLLFDDVFVDQQPFIPVSNGFESALPTSSTFGGLPGMPLQPHQPGRERWVPTLTLPHTPLLQRPLKREGGFVDQINMQPQRKNAKVDKRERTVDAAKGKRPTEQADHILRERQRRDDMTSKFAVLESLLPVGVKRDRSTIVDDSIEYVKNLHHRIKSLQDRKAELNNQSAAAAVTSNGRRGGQRAEVLHSHGSPTKHRVATPRISEEALSVIHAALRGCVEKMEVHADLPRQVVIEMVCKPQPRLQSHILICLESLDLDVMQCSITKIAHRLICVITAKPQGVNTATSGIVAALKCALQG